MQTPAQTVAQSKTIGEIDCLCCSRSLPVKLNGRDTLNTSCPWCGFSSYAKAGTEAHGIVSGWMRKTAAQAAQKPESDHMYDDSDSDKKPAAKPASSPLASLAKSFQLGEV